MGHRPKTQAQGADTRGAATLVLRRRGGVREETPGRWELSAASQPSQKAHGSWGSRVRWRWQRSSLKPQPHRAANRGIRVTPSLTQNPRAKRSQHRKGLRRTCAGDSGCLHFPGPALGAEFVQTPASGRHQGDTCPWLRREGPGGYTALALRQAHARKPAFCPPQVFE